MTPSAPTGLGHDIAFVGLLALVLIAWWRLATHGALPGRPVAWRMPASAFLAWQLGLGLLAATGFFREFSQPWRALPAVGLSVAVAVWMFSRPAHQAWLAGTPVWGWVARAHGVIPVDRDSGSAAVRLMLKAGKDAIAQGRAIVIFPEGTRVPHGEKPPLGAGLAGMYRLLGLPIIPIALDSGLYSPKKSFFKKAGVIRLKVGEIIPTGLPRDEVEARVHAAINALND